MVALLFVARRLHLHFQQLALGIARAGGRRPFFRPKVCRREALFIFDVMLELQHDDIMPITINK